MIPKSAPPLVPAPATPWFRAFEQDALARFSAVLPRFGRKRPRQIGSSRGTFSIGFLFLLATLLFFLPGQVNGAHRLATLDETVKIADTIIHGKIADASAKWIEDDRGKHIYTYATVESIGYWKGGGNQRIVVEWPGGTVGHITEEVSEYQSLSVGEEVVFFLNKNLRPAVGIYSKCLVEYGVVSGVGAKGKVDDFFRQIGSLTGVRRQQGDLKKSAVQDGVPHEGGTQVIDAATPDVRVQRMGPNTNLKAQTGMQPGDPVVLASEIYGNTTLGSGWYAPGSDFLVLDYGTSAGGKVTAFTFCYVTTLASPGTVKIKFWTGSSGSTAFTGSSYIAGWNFPSLQGSPVPGSAYRFYATYTIPTAEQFTLPSGAFGYSYEFASTSTGANPATGGTGNEDYFWKYSYSAATWTKSWFGGSPYASFHMSVSANPIGGTPPSITSISPSSASAGTATPVTITGSNFGASRGSSVVEFYYMPAAYSQPKMPATVYTSWSDTSITCLVPVGTINGYPGSAGSGPVTVTTAGGISGGYTFTVPFGYGQYKWPGAFPTMTFVINENCADCTGEGAAFQSAGTTWNNAGAKFALIYGGATTATTKSQNSINEVMWGSFADPLTIAEATIWKNDLTMTITECDIMFNDPDNVWNTSGSPSGAQMDVQTTAVHELGHWLMLRDLYGSIGDGVNDNGKIMYGFGSGGQLKRNLATADRDGIRWIYGMDTTPPVVAITSPTSNPTYSTANSTLTLGGTASDEVGVTQVSWANDRGGSGTASGTTTWNVSGISLLAGANVLTVTARDAAGNMATDTLTVTSDTLPPTFSSVVASPAVATLGTAVTITFAASESLSGNPTVTVNTRAASHVSKSGNNYAYSYTIQALDADGDATIAISGMDLVGNSGSVSNTTALDVSKIAPTITTPTPLTSGAVGTAYSQTFAATGGTTPYTWAISAGTLPAGLSLSTAGVLSGTPTAAVVASFTVKVTGANSLFSTKAFGLTIEEAPTITTPSPLPSGVKGTAYSQTLTATGGTTPYAWTVAAGSLPTGLALSTAGVLSGTPTAGVTASFTVKVTGANSLFSTKVFSLMIGVAPTITAPSPLRSGVVGTAYTRP
ncbi:MAG: putative Ig domain-containing protein [Verrucomicrobia bacterium]|nr:putative Ig domain-containing protein [Verrucomicrobiota bacterium]